MANWIWYTIFFIIGFLSFAWGTTEKEQEGAGFAMLVGLCLMVSVVFRALTGGQ